MDSENVANRLGTGRKQAIFTDCDEICHIPIANWILGKCSRFVLIVAKEQ